MTSEFRIGLVGCGRLAQRGYVHAIERVPDVRLAAVVDPVAERRAEVAPHVPRFEHTEDLIAAGSVDGLVLATPAGAHLADARRAAEVGLPALIEKPPAADAAEAALLAALDPAPWIGFNRRFEPPLAALRARLSTGRPLELRLLHHGRRRAWDPYVVRDDVLLTLGPHLLDLACWLTGTTVERVRARELGYWQAGLDIELSHGRAWVDCRMDRLRRELVEARDPAGARVERLVVGGLVRHAAARLRPARESPLVSTLARQLQAFVRAARGGPSGKLGTARDGLRVMATIDATRRSAAAGGVWEKLEPSPAAAG